jgi:hypothetical protein
MVALFYILSNTVHLFDIAAQPLSLNLQGRTSFTSLCGGLTGVVIYSLVAIFTYQMTVQMVTL